MIIKCTVNAKLCINFVHLCNEELNFLLFCTCTCTQVDKIHQKWLLILNNNKNHLKIRKHTPNEYVYANWVFTNKIKSRLYIYVPHSFLPTNGALTQVPVLGKNTKFYEVYRVPCRNNQNELIENRHITNHT